MESCTTKTVGICIEYRHFVGQSFVRQLLFEWNLSMRCDDSAGGIYEQTQKDRYEHVLKKFTVCRLGTADRRRAQWKALTRRARRGKNAEAFLKSYERNLKL